MSMPALCDCPLDGLIGSVVRTLAAAGEAEKAILVARQAAFVFGPDWVNALWNDLYGRDLITDE
jgi:hypothetical protein